MTKVNYKLTNIEIDMPSTGEHAVVAHAANRLDWLRVVYQTHRRDFNQINFNFEETTESAQMVEQPYLDDVDTEKILYYRGADRQNVRYEMTHPTEWVVQVELPDWWFKEVSTAVRHEHLIDLLRDAADKVVPVDFELTLID